MDDWLLVVLLTWMAGLAMPVGGLFACWEKIQPAWLEDEFRHTVIAFGGGALLSAVALVLIPEGSEVLTVGPVSVLFLLGGLTFLGLDVLMDRFRSSTSQLLAMMSDFVPEAISLGAAFAAGKPVGMLLAGLIAIQNLPEGFNSFREMTSSGKISARKVLVAFALLSLMGPISGLVGFFYLAQFPQLVAGIMVFAAGGILYLVFQDIAPQAKLRNRFSPAMGAILGFLLGLVGKMLID